MWLATTYGFFSIVCAHDDVGQPDPDLMMIRARSKEHLASLKRRFTFLGDIASSSGTDYPYRIIVEKSDVSRVAASLISEIDYKNFKDAAHDAAPSDDSYMRFLARVWREGLQLTEAE